ncbi:MAG: DUF3105 domain-containing protein [Kineosporiaceae bacterium]
MAKTMDRNRKARVEEMRRAQAAADRRRTALIVGAAVVVVIVLAAVVLKVVRDAQAEKDVASLGATPAAASCDTVTDDKPSGQQVHVGPQTNQPNVTKVAYATVPPAFGEHFVTPAYPALPFYSAQDRPRMETLVHNLEHGYTIVWYTSATPQTQVDQLKKVADLARAMPETSGKFIVSAWDDAYGSFPKGKTVGISHWGKDVAHRQLCGTVSGEAIKTFITAHPYSDSPEPQGA